MAFKYRDLASEVVRACPAGHALVLRCHPVFREGGKITPFPTLFWLACPTVVRAIAKLERAGAIARFERRIAEDAELRMRVLADHDAYVAERWSMLASAEVDALRASGQFASLERGIGGIRDRTSVKCLHLHAAHHLARGSTIGQWIEELAPLVPCAPTPQGGQEGTSIPRKS